MCTVSIVPHRSGIRIVCNRDERRDRPAAEPPLVRAAGSLRALWPTDPFSAGTWIGVNEAGLALVLLNRNPRAGKRLGAPPRSRGTIIPPLLRLGEIDSVLSCAGALESDWFEPFTLVVVQDTRLAVIRNTERAVDTTRARVRHPLVFTSSSLGDDLVSMPREQLFARLVRDTPEPLRGQAAFHRHRWRRRPEISVCMSRADATTVSRTVLDIGRERARLRYTALWPRSDEASSVSLDLVESIPASTGSQGVCAQCSEPHGEDASPPKKND